MHYLTRKNAIAQAIVEADPACLAQIIEELAMQLDPAAAALDSLLVGDGSELGLAMDTGLSIEIMAEAICQPSVASI